MFISGRLYNALIKIRKERNTKNLIFGRNYDPNSCCSFSSSTVVFPHVTPFWMSRLNTLGIKRPTETQLAVLSALAASKKHCLIQAETGSGKTLAYLLPIADALKKRIEALENEKQLFPVALIVVPTQELVAQVVATAQKLLPHEWQNMVRGCHGNVGLPKNMNCGIAVATPRAVIDTVHVAHRSKDLLYVVLDEADALLSGALRTDTIQGVLTPFKMVMPAERPLHIFCAATFPNRGKDSVSSFLDKYYPESECQRVATNHSHKHLRAVYQSFLQLDASLPLTSFEILQRERLSEKVKKIAKELNEPKKGVQGQETVYNGDDNRDGILEEKDKREKNIDTTFVASNEEELIVEDDSILVASTARMSEDKHLAAKADEERYLVKVDSLRRDAIIDALLMPARLFGIKGVELNNATKNDKNLSEKDEGGGSMSRRARSRSSSLLTSLVDEPLKTEAKKNTGRGSERMAKEATMSILSAEMITNHILATKTWPKDPTLSETSEKDNESKTIDHTVDTNTVNTDNDDINEIPQAPTPRIFPYQPLSQSRPKFSDAECDLIPTTLIFMNSSAGAYSMKRFLADRLPSIRISDIHSDIPDAARRARLTDFVSGRIRILVCTNLAARGLDTVNVVHVIQAEFASDVVGHIHRVGRTARAGRAGLVTNLIIRRDMDLVHALVNAKDGGLSHLFSKDRSLKRQMKKATLSSAEDHLVMAVLVKEEENELRKYKSLV